MRSLCSLVIALFLFLYPPCSLADGIPVDEKGNATVPHSIINLSKDQIDEIESLRTLTLTSAQFDAIRKVSPGTPRRFPAVLSTDYDSCTCEVPVYCIRKGINQAIVLHEELAVDSLRWRMGESANTYVSLLADSKGEFYYGGVLIPFSVLLDALKKGPLRSSIPKSSTQPEEKRLYVYLPLGVDPLPAALKHRLDQIDKAASKTGWKFDKPKTEAQEKREYDYKMQHGLLEGG